MALRFDFTSQIVNKNGRSEADSGTEALRRLVQGIKAAHPEKVLSCEHWDVRTNAYNPWMISYVGFDAGWLNSGRNFRRCLLPLLGGSRELWLTPLTAVITQTHTAA
jgi:hypothetical protein